MLMRLIYLFFGEPSTSKAVSGVNKSIRKLEQAAGYQADKATNAAKAAEAALLAAKNAEEEAAKAGRIRERLGTIFEA